MQVLKLQVQPLELILEQIQLLQPTMVLILIVIGLLANMDIMI